MRKQFFLFLVLLVASLTVGCAGSQTSTMAPEVKPVPAAPQPTLETRPSQQQLFDSCWGVKEWPTDQATLSGCQLYIARKGVELAHAEDSEEQLTAALKSLVEAEAEYDRLQETCEQANLACFMEDELACAGYRRLVEEKVCPSFE